MSIYYKNSLSGKWLTTIYRCYLESYTSAVSAIMLNWCRQSVSNRLLRKYLEHSSTLRYSVTHKACSSIYSAVDRLFDKVYYFLKSCGKSSVTVNFFNKSLSSLGAPICLSLSVLFFSCGYGAVSMLMGIFNNIKFIIMASGLLLSLLLLAEKSKWAACLRNSLFRRIFLYFFD